MIAKNFDEAFTQVTQLVADFRQGEPHYLAPAYSESQARKDFIDKFWMALGWDVDHTEERNPYEQRVKVEHSQKEGARRKRADYAFLADNFRDVRFFVEAKKPCVEIDNPTDYFQTIRYGWNGQTPLAVLTDFQQLRVLDCRSKPDIDTAMGRVVRRFHYTDYANAARFREIYHLFSREAVAAGALEKFVETHLPKPTGRGGKAKQGLLLGGSYQSIDEAFLQALDGYREQLARSFKNRNPQLDGAALTEVTQRTLDRLVFMRFLEDKLIVAEPLVAGFGKQGAAWPEFIAASRKLDRIYNGIIFKEHRLLDAPDFKVDDQIFAEICGSLAADDSPYDFNSIPIHILGSIYERFLGKTIVATDKRARVEEKPEVRKAGGVYYTPEYIVRYIVAQTVGQLIAGKTPEEVAPLRFADIACGSGSFLLGIYDELLRHHTAYYNKNKTNRAKGLKVGCSADENGALRLSIWQKRVILLDNIYGVDVDPQAVEVAQLSLYLKLLEDETPVSARNYQLTFKEALLPSLNNNVVCGNALVDYDFEAEQLFVGEDERSLNPMSFPMTFANVMKSGGFDAIVGNPPYVRPHNLTVATKSYLWRHYKTFTHKSDLYNCFIERANQLLKSTGFLSYIVSDGWLRLNSFQELRKLILSSFSIIQLVELPFRVFAQAQVTTGIFVFQKHINDSASSRNISIIQGQLDRDECLFTESRVISQDSFLSTFENVFDLSISSESELVKQKMRRGAKIDEQFETCFGLKTGDDKKFLHFQRGLHRQDKPLLRGENVKRYGYTHEGEYVWYVPDEMKAHRKTARPGEAKRFEQPKVLVKDTTTDFACTYEDQGYYVKDVLIVTPRNNIQNVPDLKFVTGIINSRALRYYYRTTFKTIHVQRGELGSLPLPCLNLDQRIDRERHDRLVRLVEQMLAAKQQLAAAQTDRDKNFYEHKCTALDRQINHLVYELYGLTDEEIAIIEGG